MDTPTEIFHKRVRGFINSQQVRINADSKEHTCNLKAKNLEQYTPPANDRLGHYAEDLFGQQLQFNETYSKLLRNLQITEEGITKGELDFIGVKENELTHIEFCYKIYLLNPGLHQDELFQWIGPNRRDALHLKTKKLKEKQLPMLYHSSTRTQLREQGIELDEYSIEQHIVMLGQLYVPYDLWITDKIDLRAGTADGFYISFKDLHVFDNNTWHIPTKKTDWLIQPHSEVDWSSTKDFKFELEQYYDKSSSPLCWMKNVSGKVQKCFVVNWG